VLPVIRPEPRNLESFVSALFGECTGDFSSTDNAAGGDGVVAIPSYSFIHAHETSGEGVQLREESISVLE
jgi:hypothetical protein